MTLAEVVPIRRLIVSGPSPPCIMLFVNPNWGISILDEPQTTGNPSILPLDSGSIEAAVPNIRSCTRLKR